MRSTIDEAGRIEPATVDTIEEQQGRLVIPPAGGVRTVAEVQGLRDVDQK